jgi:hypothetical protein
MSSKVTDIDKGWNDIYKTFTGKAPGAYADAGKGGSYNAGGSDAYSDKSDTVFSNIKNGAAIRVGLQASDQSASDNLNMAELGTVHEFGSTDGRIPQRSFIRATFDEKLPKYRRLLDAAAKDIIAGKLTAKTALDLMGERFVKDIKARIRAHIDPPLSKYTLYKRAQKILNLAGSVNQTKATDAAGHLQEHGTLPAGAVTPLIDTGRLIASIRYVSEV